MIRSLKAGAKSLDGFGLNMFTEDELYAIHCATLEVMRDTGLYVGSKEAREILAGVGAVVDEENENVKFPPYVVEDAIRSAPSTILLAGRNPKNDYIADSKRVAFMNFGEGLRIIDPYTKEYRPTTKDDVAKAALMCDALDQIWLHNRAVGADEMPGPVQPLHNAEAIFPNISKNCFIGAMNVQNFRKMIEMASVVAGGRDKLRERPFYSTIVCPTSPLKLVPECCDILIEAARQGITVCILSMAMAGATSPVTLAGTLVTHNAEVLGGIVLSQATRKGAPIIYGSSTTIMDLKTATAPVGSPELAMINAAVAGLAQYYLLPSWVAGG